jgi:hypothetical protein
LSRSICLWSAPPIRYRNWATAPRIMSARLSRPWR